MHATKVLLLAAAVLGPMTGHAPAGPSFTITALVLEGDAVTGVGLVTRIDNIAVNNDGDWLVEVDTDQLDTNADSVLIRNGTADWREGDAVPAPGGASLGSFDSVTLNDTGRSGFNFFLDGTKGLSDDSGVYGFFDPGSAPFDGTALVVQESEAAPGLTAGTPFIGFFDVKINNANHLLVTASVDDPDIDSSVDRAMYILESDLDLGGISSFTLINAEGDVLPGQTEAIADFGTGPHTSAFNDAGETLYFVDLTGSTATDGAIYHYDGLDRLLVAQEGGASPIKGRDWLSLSSPELDLSNNGELVFSGRLTGDTASDMVIVRNDTVLRQEGDAVPGTLDGLFALTSFGTGPLEISDGGRVLWYGDWDDPDPDVDTGLFLDDDLLVQEGVTTIDGVVVDTLRGIEDGYHMSGNGRFIIFEAILLNGIEGAFLIEFPCPWDCGNGDGEVGIEDFLAVLGGWGLPGPCDFDGDGVGITDFLKLLGLWGPCP